MKTVTVPVAGYHYHLYCQTNDNSQQDWLLLHGFMGSHTDFNAVRDQLPGRVWTVDLLGYGTQQLPVNPYRQTMASQVRDFEQIFTALDLAKVNLVGYSMGGRLAIALALHPAVSRRLNHVFLESTTAGITQPVDRFTRQAADYIKAQQILYDYPAFVSAWAAQPLFASQKRLQPALAEEIRRERLAQNPLNMANSLRMMGTGSQPNFWPFLKNIPVPVDILAGRLDTKFEAIGYQLHANLPGSHLLLFDKAGHNLHQERPATYVSALTAYV